MATAGSGRGPIKVGSGYIEVYPDMDEKRVKALKAEMQKQLAAAGIEAGKDFSKGVSEGLAAIPKAAASAAEKGQKAVQKESKDSQKVLKRIEAEITATYGKEAGKRFKELQKTEEAKQKLVEETSAATKKALQSTLAEERKAATQSAKRWETAEKTRIKQAEERAAELKRLGRQEETEAASRAKALIRQNKMVYQAYAENEKRKAALAAATAKEEIKQAKERATELKRLARQEEADAASRAKVLIQQNKMIYQAYAENEKRKAALAAATAKEEIKWQSTVAQAYKENEKRKRMAMAETAALQRTQMATLRRNMARDLQSQLDGSRDATRVLQGQMAGYRRSVNDLNSAVTTRTSSIQKAWKSHGAAIETVGTQATETGRLITTNLLGPLALVSAALTGIGVQSADSLKLGQLGLMGSGATAKDSLAALTKIRQYGVDTPYSIEDMQSYLVKYIRPIESHDKNFKSTDPKKKAAAAKSASMKAGDIVQMVGDNAARAGNLDPSLVSRGMYAINMMLDTSRVGTRQMKQFADSAGVSIEELAIMMGFQDSDDKKKGTASSQMLKKMANASKTGGVDSSELIGELLSDWKAPGGSKGRAALIGTSTITGKLQQFKEQTQVGLGNLFAKPDPKTGLVEYTGLGESIMGKRTTDAKGNEQYEGGLINRVKDLAQDNKGNAVGLLKTFFDSISTFADQIQWASDFMNAHPEWKKFFASLVKMAAVAAPFILALGLGTKVLGKVTKLLGSAATPLMALGRGVRAASRVGRQVGSGVSSARQGNGFRQGYQDRRTALRGGDERGPVRRATDRVTGRNSQTNTNLTGLNNQINSTEEAIQAAEARTRDLQRQLRDLNGLSMDELIHQFGGGAGNSGGNGNLTGAAGNAGQSINNIQTQAQQLSRQSLSSVQREFTALAGDADKAYDAIKKVSQEVETLNGKNTNKVSGEFSSLHEKVQSVTSEIKDAQKEVQTLDSRKLGSLRTQQIETTKNQTQKLVTELKSAASEASDLNGKSLKGFRKEVTSTTTAANNLSKKLKELLERVTSLDGKSLNGIKGRFRGNKSSLYNAINDVYKLAGTSNSGLNGRLSNINSRSLASITKAVKELRDALKSASTHADDLDDNIRNVNSDSSFSGGGSSGGSKKKKKSAAGGVVTSLDSARYGTLPGYAPGVDNIPAILSPGEAVLRPEVARAIGPTTIDSWNSAAMSGQVQKFAGGSSMVAQMRRATNIWPEVNLFGSTVAFDASAEGVDSRTSSSLIPWGSRNGGRTAGRGTLGKLDETLNFFTEKLPDLLKHSPGLGKVAGVIAGALAPYQADNFMKDIWHGNGNIAQRTLKYVKDMYDPKTLWKILKSAGTGTWDSITSLGSSIKGLVTDPVGTIEDAAKDLKDNATSYLGGVRDQFALLQKIRENPGKYTSEVFDQYWAEAKSAMPNTEGLFKFANGGVVPGYSPDDDRVHALLSPGEAVLRPEAARALGLSNIGLLNKAAKSGDINNLRDKSGEIIPAPDSETFKKAADKIDDSLKGSRKSVESTRDTSNKAWADTGNKVKSAANAVIVPAISRVISQEGSLQKDTSSKMAAVKSSVSSAASGTSKSFGSMKSGLSSLQGSFSSAQKNIDKSMDKLPGSVKSNVKSAVNFIQASMISPVNSKLLGPAKLSKIGNLPGFAAGGVVPGYTPGRDSVLAMLSPGESVLRPEVTRALGEGTVHALNQAAMSGQIQAFAKGGVVGSWADAVPGMFSETAGPILKKLVTQFGKTATTWPRKIGQAGVKKSGPAIEEILAGKDKKFLESMASLGGGAGGAERWSPLVLQVLKQLGLSSKYLSLVLHRINVESGGNPNAINLWDSNAKAGHPSQGLMQTIPGTFNAYAGPYKKLGITNPLASIYAGLNYATHRYGSHWTQALSGTQGYWTGTRSASPGLKLVGERGAELVDFRGGERVYNHSDTAGILSGGRPIELHIHEAKHEDTTQATVRGLQWIDTMYGNRL